MKKISKEIVDKGVIYRNELGKQIETYTDDLGDILRVGLEPLRDFLFMEFEETETKRMANVAQTLLAAMEVKLSDALEYIDDNFGTISIERAVYHQKIKPETMLGIVYKPCKKVIDG